MDDTVLRHWIAGCDPQQSIDSSDPRYFNLDQVEVEGRRVDLRGNDHIEGLFDAIALTEGNSCQLFSGFSGTGKSTELRRLTHQLEAAGYAVLLVNSLDYHDLNHPLTIEDLMVIITGSFGEATAELLGEKVAPKPYWQQLKDFLEHDLEFGDVKIPLGISDLKIGIKHEKSFWLEMRKALAGSPGKLREHSHAHVRRCVAAIRQAKYPLQGVVFVFDSLERLSSTATDFRKVMESAVQVMAEYPDFLKLPACHSIYTVPPSVQLISPGLKDRYDRTSLVLPSVKVLERNGDTPFRPGIEALASLVGKRIPLDQVFGTRRDLLEKLIVYSGGHVRSSRKQSAPGMTERNLDTHLSSRGRRGRRRSTSARCL